jgi:steroid delta-isomerase-like uncharacterized protein
MKFFKSLRNKNKKDQQGSSNDPPSSLNNDTVYTDTRYSAPQRQQQQSKAQAQAQAHPPSTPPRGTQAAPRVESVTHGVNHSGRRVTSTTVHIPPAESNESKSPQSAQSIDSAQLTNDLTRSLVKKFIAEIWNRGEIDLIPDVCSANLRLNGNTGFDRVGHDGLARMVSLIRNALDDYHCEIHSMVVEHNKAFCRLRFTGKHVGTLLGFEATGKVVAWMGATEFTCQNGKILKVWELGDLKNLEDQLKSSMRSEDEI